MANNWNGPGEISRGLWRACFRNGQRGQQLLLLALQRGSARTPGHATTSPGPRRVPRCPPSSSWCSQGPPSIPARQLLPSLFSRAPVLPLSSFAGARTGTAFSAAAKTRGRALGSDPGGNSAPETGEGRGLKRGGGACALPTHALRGGTDRDCDLSSSDPFVSVSFCVQMAPPFFFLRLFSRSSPRRAPGRHRQTLIQSSPPLSLNVQTFSSRPPRPAGGRPRRAVVRCSGGSRAPSPPPSSGPRRAAGFASPS